MAEASLWLKQATGSFHGLRQAPPSGNVTAITTSVFTAESTIYFLILAV